MTALRPSVTLLEHSRDKLVRCRLRLLIGRRAARNNECMGVGPCLSATKDIGKGYCIEVHRPLERGNFPFAIPMEACLPATKESDRACVVDIWIGDLALEC